MDAALRLRHLRIPLEDDEELDALERAPFAGRPFKQRSGLRIEEDPRALQGIPAEGNLRELLSAARGAQWHALLDVAR